MREILFRGKRLDNGEWAIGGFCEMDGSVYIAKAQKIEIVNAKTRETTKAKVLDTYEVAPATVGQFTGQMDMNDKRIFEGDVVAIQPHTEFELAGRVVFEDGSFLVVDPIDDMIEFLWYKPHEMEVLGNIHDNPELLEGG